MSLIICAGLALAMTGLFLRKPRSILLAFLVFLLFQDFLVALFGGRASVLGGALQNLDELGLLLIAAAAFVLAVQRGTFRPAGWNIWWLGFAVACALSIQLAGSGWGRGLVGFVLVSKGFLFAFAVDQTVWQPGDDRRWIRMIAAVVGVHLVFAIPDLVAPAAFRAAVGFDPGIEYRGALPSVMSLAGHPGGFGWIAMVGLLIALATMLTRGPRSWWLLAAMSLVGVILSARRKPVIGMAIALLATLAVRRGRISGRGLVIGFAAVALVLVPAAALLWPVLVGGLRAYLGESAVTVQARTALYAGAYLLARQYLPFGVGLGRYGSYGSIVDYSDVYYRFGFNAIYGMSPTFPNFIQDTFWPQVLGETGVIGLVCYAGAIAMILANIAAAARRTPGRNKWLPMAAFLILIETLFESGAAPSFTTASQACLSLGLARLAIRVPVNEIRGPEAVNA